MSAGKTTVTLSLDELALLRLWLDEGFTQGTENLGDEWDETNEPDEITAIRRLDEKLQRAVNRCHRAGRRDG